jgi:hypothetical protein
MTPEKTRFVRTGGVYSSNHLEFMSDQQPSRSSVLVILGAFTLGVICMACVVFVIQTLTPQPRMVLAPAYQDRITAPDSGKEPTFSRRAQSLNLAPPPQPAVTPVRQPAKFPATPQAPLAEDQPLEDSQPDLQAPAANPVSRPEPGLPQLTGALAVNEGPRAGSILGRAVLVGKPPLEKPLPLDVNCGRVNPGLRTTRFFRTSGDGGLADVFIVVTEGLPDTSLRQPTKPAVLRFTGCLYEPYISIARVGQEIRIENTDPVMHNLHFLPQQGKELNSALLPRHSKSVTLTSPELFAKFKCDLHPWEQAYVSAVDHPFAAVTDADGRFMLPPLRPGKYKLQAYHRKAGQLSQEVELNPNESRSVEFSFSLPSEPAPLLTRR